MLFMLNIMGSIIVGALAGWIAGKIMKCEGSFLRNIVLGIVGGIIGNIVFNMLEIHAYGMIGNLIISVVGACILIWIVRKITKQ